MSRQRSSPRKFSEKIALLNKKEAEHNAEFEKIIKEVEETTRAPNPSPYPTRTSSFSNCCVTYPNGGRRSAESQAYNSHAYDNDSGSQNQLFHCSLNDTIPVPGMHTHHHHHHHNPRIHMSHQSQTSPMQQTNIIHSNATSPGVPNIKISTIDDGSGLVNQQVNYFNSNNCLNQQSTISSARSLPDITNLRVSGTLTAPSIGPSYSDQRLHIDVNQLYDANSNLLSGSSAHELYCSDTLDAPTQQQQSSGQAQVLHHHHHNHQCDNVWQAENQFDQHNSNSSNHQSFCSQSQQVPNYQNSSIARANSFNTVCSTNWQSNGQVETLSAPIDCNNLSKSSEGYYSLVEESYSSPNSCPCPNALTNQTANLPMVKSSSHNNIDNIDPNMMQIKHHIFLEDHNGPQQPQLQMHSGFIDSEPCQSFYR